MTRHARNCTAGAVYTYHEKKKDAAASGYGTQAARLGKDSVKNFDDCSLTLQPCRNPVVTKDGVLFDKEAILEYILNKKSEYRRKLKEYEKQLRREEEEMKQIAEAERESKLIHFMNKEKNITDSKAMVSSMQSSSKPSSSSGDKKLPSFWIPSQLPDAKRTKLDKPDPTVYCPITGKPLKMKDLVEVKWTLVPVDAGDKKSLIARTERYMCAITKDVLTNAVDCAVIRPTGEVVTWECVEKMIRPENWLHPITGVQLKETDVIRLQRGGTGYSTTNDNLFSSNMRPVLQA